MTFDRAKLFAPVGLILAMLFAFNAKDGADYIISGFIFVVSISVIIVDQRKKNQNSNSENP